MVTLMIACFGGGLLLTFYSFVTVAAFKSAMVYLIVAGAAAILIGIGLGLIILFKKYYAFYNKKMGWKFEKEPQKTVTGDSTPLVKRIFTVSNASLAALALGAILAIISAALGSIERDNWVDAFADFRNERGFYADVKYVAPHYIIDDLNDDSYVAVNTVEVDFSKLDTDARRKKVVVEYTEEEKYRGFVWISGIVRFDGELTVFSPSNGAIKVSVGPPPKIEPTAINKLLFFMLNDYNYERQIVIRIPIEYKDKIDVVVHDVVE